LPNWARETSRTQGGGWNWYPGSAADQDKERAVYLATNRALDYMVKECATIPLGTKFHERFDRHKNGYWEIYVRASVKDAECRKTKVMKDETKFKYTHKSLGRQYAKYIQDFDTVEIDSQICHGYHTVGCFIVSTTAWKRGKLKKAAAYAREGCRLGHSESCGHYGMVLWDMQRLSEALSYLKKACSYQVDQYCEDATYLEDKINQLAKR
jgi:hypothetical protein